MYCCLVVTMGPVVARTQEISSEGRKHFAAARQAQDAGSLDRAVEEYLETIRIQPGFAEAYNNLGLIYYVQGKFTESASALSSGLQIKPTLIGANLYLGVDYIKSGHANEAIPYLRRAVRLEPGNKDAQSWLGTAYWESGRKWQALQQLRQTEISFPNDPDIMFVLGEAYRKAADQEMESVIRGASGTAYVHEVFGDIYLEQHELAKAAGHYRKALEEDPGAVHVHYGLGEVSLRGEHLDAAEEEYRLELRMTPASAASKARLAEIALLKGEIPLSLELLKEAVAISPVQAANALRVPPSFATTDERFSDEMLGQLRSAIPALEAARPGAARSLALATVNARVGLDGPFHKNWMDFQSAMPMRDSRLNLWDRANDRFERQSFYEAEVDVHTWLATYPRDLKAQYLAARIHRNLSLGVLDLLLKAFPESYRSHQLLAQTFEQRDKDDAAIAEYRKAEELVPTLPGLHFAIGHLLLKDGDLDQATAELKDELQINPDNAVANAEIGQILVAQTQEEAAIVYLVRAITLQPDLWVAHEELGKAYYIERSYEKAVKELKLAITDDPEGAAHYQLGMVYKALGRSDDAKREFEAARKIKADRLSQIKIEMPEGTKE